LNLTDKQKIVDDLHGRLSDAQIVIVTDYKGLDVESITKLRKELRESDVEFQVAKNTLLTKASENTDAALIQDHFKGPSAIALSSTDPVAPAKILTKFAEDNDKLEIRVGVMNGKALTLDDIKALSTMPSREELLGKLVSVLHAVPTSFVRVLNEVPRSMVNVLQAIKDDKDAA
jgi:large subunit ribosomal protein L10